MPAGRTSGCALRRVRTSDRAPRRILAVALVTASVAFAGCGASSSAAPTAVSSAAPPAQPTGPAPSMTPLPPGSFTVDLPAGWRAIPVVGSHDAIVAAVRSRNPAFADSLEARLANLADTTTYVAVDTSPAAVETGAPVMLVVTEVALPADVSLQTFATTINGQVEQLVEADVELDQILVTAGQAFTMTYEAPVTRPDGQTGSAAVTQVLYLLPGRGYVLTFAVPTAQASDYAREIAEIVTSFTIRT
jgi:hypothetical protein